jgi:hypothetical protein
LLPGATLRDQSRETKAERLCRPAPYAERDHGIMSHSQDETIEAVWCRHSFRVQETGHAYLRDGSGEVQERLMPDQSDDRGGRVPRGGHEPGACPEPARPHAAVLLDSSAPNGSRLAGLNSLRVSTVPGQGRLLLTSVDGRSSCAL